MIGSPFNALPLDVPSRGTSTNDSAAAGYIGEYTSAQLAQASATSLTSNTAKTIISVSLTAGDWDVWGIVAFIPAGTTTVTRMRAQISASDNTAVGNDTFNFTALPFAGGVPGNLFLPIPTPVVRVSLASTTTYYLVADSSFGTSTMTAAGEIRARRVR